MRNVNKAPMGTHEKLVELGVITPCTIKKGIYVSGPHSGKVTILLTGEDKDSMVPDLNKLLDYYTVNKPKTLAVVIDVDEDSDAIELEKLVGKSSCSVSRISIR